MISIPSSAMLEEILDCLLGFRSWEAYSLSTTSLLRTCAKICKINFNNRNWISNHKNHTCMVYALMIFFHLPLLKEIYFSIFLKIDIKISKNTAHIIQTFWVSRVSERISKYVPVKTKDRDIVSWPKEKVIERVYYIE